MGLALAGPVSYYQVEIQDQDLVWSTHSTCTVLFPCPPLFRFRLRLLAPTDHLSHRVTPTTVIHKMDSEPDSNSNTRIKILSIINKFSTTRTRYTQISSNLNDRTTGTRILIKRIKCIINTNSTNNTNRTKAGEEGEAEVGVDPITEALGVVVPPATLVVGTATATPTTTYVRTTDPRTTTTTTTAMMIAATLGTDTGMETGGTILAGEVEDEVEVEDEEDGYRLKTNGPRAWI